MRKNLLLSLVLLCAGFSFLTSNAQTAYNYFNSSNLGKSIAPGTSNQLIYSNYFYRTATNVWTMTGFNYSLVTSLQSTDVPAGGLKLWYSFNNNFDQNAILISSTNLPTSTTSGNLVFSTSGVQIPTYDPINQNYVYTYFFVTLDVNTVAGLGNTVLISNLSTITGQNSSFSNQSSNNTSYLSTITTSAISFSSGSYSNYYIAKGGTDMTFGSLYISNNLGSNILSSLTATTTGTYSLNDLVPNPIFKLYYSDNSSNPWVLVATTPGVASGNSFTFTSLNYTAGTIKTGYGNWYITTDISATSTTNGRSIGIKGLKASDISLVANTITGTSNDYTRTIYNNFNFYSNTGYQGSNIVQSNQDNVVLNSFQLYNYNGSFNLNTITLSMAGTYFASDLKNGKISLYKSSNYSFSPTNAVLLKEFNSSAAGNGEVLTANLNLNVEIGTYPYYFLVTSISPNASIGNRITVLESLGSRAFNLTGGTYTGVLYGGEKLIAQPTLITNTETIPSSGISRNTSNANIYTFKVNSSLIGANMNRVTVTTSGTFQTGDINGMYLYRSSSADYTNSNNWNYIGSNNSVTPGGKVEFNITNTIYLSDQYYYFLVPVVSGSASSGSTLQILVNSTSVGVSNGAAVNSLVNGSIFTISAPTITATKVDVPSSKLYPSGNLNQSVYTFKLNVQNANAFLTSFNISLGGSYTSSDFQYIYLYRTQTPEFDPNNASSLNYFYPNSTGGGENLTVNTNANLSLGDNYIHIVPLVNRSPKDGNTLVINSISGFSFNGLTIASNLNTGNIHTIGLPIITFENQGNSDGFITPNTTNEILKIKVNVTNASAVLNALTLTTTGTYSSSDIPYYYLYASDNGTVNINSDPYIRFLYSNSSGNGEVIKLNSLNKLLVSGRSTYLHLFAYVSGSATPGDFITTLSLNTSSGTFYNGTVNSAFFAGAKKTILNVTSVFGNNIPSSNLTVGTNGNPIYSFSFKPAYYSSLESFTLTLTGSFASTTFGSNFSLYYSSQSVLGSNYSNLRNVSLTNGNVLNFNSLSYGLYNSSDPVYFYVIASVASNAADGSTITANVNSQSFVFNSGTAVGNFISGNQHTIVRNPVITLGNGAQYSNQNVAPGLQDVNMYSFSINSNASYYINYLTMSVSGTYTSNDVNYVNIYSSKSADGANMTYVGYGYFYKSISTSSGENLYLYMSRTFGSGNTYFFVKSSIVSSASNGRTFQVSSLKPGDINLQGGSVGGNTLGQGNVTTIVVPNVSISQISIPSSGISPGAGQVIYGAQVNSNVAAYLNSLTLTLSGTFTGSDIDNFSVYVSTSSSFNQYNYLNYNNVNPTSFTRNFSVGLGVNIPAGNSYLYFVANASSNAIIGRTISMLALSKSTIDISGATVTGANLSDGNIFSIGSGTAKIGSYPLNGSTIAQGAINQIIHILPITVSGASLNLNTYYPLIRGNYATSDIVPSSLKLWVNTNPNLTNATKIYNNSINNAGNYSYFYPYATISEGAQYLIVTVDVSSTATVGDSLFVDVVQGNSLSFGGNVYPTGFSTKGGVFKIVVGAGSGSGSGNGSGSGSGSGTGSGSGSGTGGNTLLEDEFIANGISLYPTPANKQVVITIPGLDSNVKMVLMDATGTVVGNHSLQSETSLLDVSNMTNGLYLAKFEFKGKSITKRIVVMN